MNAGVIGLGVMGLPMTSRLLAAGHRVTVTTRSPARADPVVTLGAVWEPTASGVAAAVDVLLVIVPTAEDLEAVLDGPSGALEGARPGLVILAMGTHAPGSMPPLAVRAAERGATLLDAPVSGGEVGAREGTLSIMVGGDTDAFERARPLLEVLGTRIEHVGTIGMGQAMKACNQLVVGSTIEAVAEALALAAAVGLDPAQVRRVLSGGFAASRILDEHGARMIAGNFEPGGRAALHAKDARIVLGLAAEHGLELPGFAPVARAFDQLVETGRGDLDHSALITLLGPRPDDR